jgi:glycerate 2-kinase
MLQQYLDAVLAAAKTAADPGLALKRYLQRESAILRVNDRTYSLNDPDIRLVVAGKGAIPMAQTFADILGDVIRQAVVVTKYDHTENAQFPAHWQVIEAAHPVPDANSGMAGDQVCQLLADCTERTLILAGISGGASALLVAPYDGITLGTLQAINQTLLGIGIDIQEMNAVRSRLDRLKGGGLVELAQPGKVLGLILSDVIGDPIDVIASGLTHHPQADNVLIGNNRQTCEAIAQVFKTLGYQVRIVTTALDGEAKVRGQEIARQIIQEMPGTVLIYGGETTVTLGADASGKGGRNQELALAAAIVLHQQTTPAVVMTLATDGTDGPTDAAGAIVDQTTIQRAIDQGLDAQSALDRHDSYSFLAQLSSLVMTGPTGTNVADITIALKPNLG